MKDGEVFSSGGRDFDARRGFRKGLHREKREGQVCDSFAEFGAGGSVPGVDFVERFQRGAVCVFGYTDEIKACVGDGSCFIGEAD
jgi:hypothetical protein